jgi:hypothetical protein
VLNRGRWWLRCERRVNLAGSMSVGSSDGYGWSLRRLWVSTRLKILVALALAIARRLRRRLDVPVLRCSCRIHWCRLSLGTKVVLWWCWLAAAARVGLSTDSNQFRRFPLCSKRWMRKLLLIFVLSSIQGSGFLSFFSLLFMFAPFSVCEPKCSV